MMSQRDRLATYAESLYAARRDRVAIPPLSEGEVELTVDDAYAVQQHLVTMIRRDGSSIIGYKLGLTSKGMQELLGVDEPDYGPVLSTMVHESGSELPAADFLQPRIEAEIALVLARDLQGPNVTVRDVAGAVGGAMAALELVDSRIEDWRITLVDTIADLASSAAIVLGLRVVDVTDLDLRDVEMAIRRNGEVEATGAGAATLGSPLAAAAWLANTLASHGVRLEAGHVIMTGSLHKAFPVQAGDRIRADFDRLGSVTCRFT